MDTTSKLNVAKGIIKFVAGSSATYVASTAIKTYVPHFNKLQKLEVAVGALAIGGMVGDSAGDWAGDTFDETVVGIQTFLEHLRKENPDE